MEKNRIKLEDLKKDNVFKVPERYFDELPSTIQSRIAKPVKPEPIWIFRPAVQYATVAASVLLFVVYFSFFRTPVESPVDVEGLIAQIETEELISYLDDSDITTEELLASVDLENLDFDELGDDTMLLDDIYIDELESIDYLESIEVSSELL